MKTKYLKVVNLLIIPLLILLISCGDTIDGNSDNKKVYIAPNPMNSFGEVTFTIYHPILVTVFITDRFGREILRPLENELLQRGTNTISMDVSKLPSGQYSCIVDQGGTKTITEFTVVK